MRHGELILDSEGGLPPIDTEVEIQEFQRQLFGLLFYDILACVSSFSYLL